jgi:hypothetical protein
MSPLAEQWMGLIPGSYGKALTVSEAEEVLSESGISYVIEEYPFEDNAVCLRADAGVKLIFSGAHRQLCPLSYSDGAI